MTLRNARVRKNEALASRGAQSKTLLPIDPNYRHMTPGSPEAIALLNTWRPALYGYAGVFADAAYQEVVAMGDGPFGLLKRKVIDDPSTLAPLTDFVPGRVWTGYGEMRRAFFDMNEAACDIVVNRHWASEQGLLVPFDHCEQLLDVFRMLDVEQRFDGVPLTRGGELVRVDRYRSLREFVLSGLNTGGAVAIKNVHLAGELVGTEGDPADVVAISKRSRVPKRLASLELHTFFAVHSALTVGNFSRTSGEEETYHAFDPWGFRLLNPQKPAGPRILDLAIDPEDIVIPKTTTFKEYAHDVSGPDVRRVRDVLAQQPPELRRPAIGCLGLLAKDDGVSIIAAYRDWTADVAGTSHLAQRHLEELRYGRDREVFRNGSVVGAMLGKAGLGATPPPGADIISDPGGIFAF